MSDQAPMSTSSDTNGSDPLPRLVQTLADQVEATRSAWDRIERQAIPLLERIALALERGERSGQRSESKSGSDQSPTQEVQAAIEEGQWDHAAAIVATLAAQPGHESAAEVLAIELNRGRERAIATWTDRIEASRLANDAASALESRDQLATLLGSDDLKAIDRDMVGWLMKLIQRRLRIIPISADLATLVARVADRFGATPEGASLSAALPTLRRSAGLCPRCAEPYLGVDEACPKCLSKAGLTPSPAPTLTFVTPEDDLDALVDDSTPLDLNEAKTWQLP